MKYKDWAKKEWLVWSMFIKFALISVRMEKQKKNLTQVNKKPKTNNINSVDAILMINFYLSLSL